MVRTLAVASIVSALVLCGCAPRAVRHDLGGGFERVTPPIGEGADLTGNGDHLYFRGSDLGKVEFLSVSPSGSHAVFARKGELFLIASKDGNLKPVTDGEFAMPAEIHWSEDEGLAEVIYEGERPSSRITLR